MPVDILPPQSGPLTQGTVFTCANLDSYPGCATYGLVITARCDVAHGKARTINFLPVVTLDDWLHHDGRLIIAERLLAESLGGMKDTLRACGYSAAVLDTETPQRVLQAIFPDATIPAKQRERFEKQCGRFELARRCIESDPAAGMCFQVATEVPKLRDGMFIDLINNRIGGFYFLKRVEYEGPDIGYVVLIREVQSMSAILASAVCNGLDASLYDSMCEDDPSLRNRVRIAYADLALPVGILPSPQLEHLMQTFSFLFGRIGLPDPDSEYVAKLWSRQPSVSLEPRP